MRYGKNVIPATKVGIVEGKLLTCASIRANNYCGPNRVGPTEAEMLRIKSFALEAITAWILGFEALAADVAVSANNSQAQTAEDKSKEPRIELETESEATTRRNWGVYVQGTGALKGSLDESGFRARIGFGYSGYNYPLTGSELIGAQLPDAPSWLGQIGKIGKITGYELGADILLG
jgi:hypothetical protein